MEIEFRQDNKVLFTVKSDVIPRVGERCVIKDTLYKVEEVFHVYEYDGRGNYDISVSVHLL